MEHIWIPGEYNLVVTNWADGTPATDYVVQVFQSQSDSPVTINGEAGTSENIQESWKIADRKYIEDFKPEIPTPSNDDIDPVVVITNNTTDGELDGDIHNDTNNLPPSPDHNDPNSDGCLGDWMRTNAFGPGERCVGPVDSHAACVEKVKSACPGFDLANVADHNTN